MGSGKSSVGRRVANSLSIDFHDTDEIVTSTTHRSVRELFAEGEEAFRRHEREALLLALESCAARSGVVATGGGVVTRRDNVEDIARSATHVVWLDADIDELVARTAHANHRPLLDGDARGKLIEMRDARNDLYATVSTNRIPTKGRTIAQIVDEVTRLVGGGSS